jgi:hypothetical protein
MDLKARTSLLLIAQELIGGPLGGSTGNPQRRSPIVVDLRAHVPQRVHDPDTDDRLTSVQILAQEFIGIDFLSRCHDECIPEGNPRQIGDFRGTRGGFDRSVAESRHIPIRAIRTEPPLRAARCSSRVCAASGAHPRSRVISARIKAARGHAECRLTRVLCLLNVAELFPAAVLPHHDGVGRLVSL